MATLQVFCDGVEGSEALPEFDDRNFAEPVITIDINRTKIANFSYW